MTEQQQAAMRQALEALDKIHFTETYFGHPDGLFDLIGNGHFMYVEAAITALRRALADDNHKQQPADKPVAFQIFKPTPPRLAIPNVRDAELPWVYDQDPSSGNVASMWVTPVTRPQPTVPQRSEDDKQWVGLTDEEYEAIAAETLFPVEYGRAIESKLREKNGGQK